MTPVRRSERVLEVLQAALQPSRSPGPTMLVHPCDGFVSERCVRAAAFLAARLNGEVLGLGRGASAEHEELLDGLTAAAACKFEDILQEAGVNGRWRAVAYPDLQVVEAMAHEADLIVTAPSADPGAFSDTGAIRRLLSRTGRPVYVCHGEAPPRADRILVCWNDSAQCRRAVMDALALLQRARLVVVLLVCLPGEEDHLAPRMREVVRGLRDRGVTAKPLVRPVREGRLADVVRNVAASESSDLIVAGAYGRGPLLRAVTGSHTEALLRSAPAPLFLSR